MTEKDYLKQIELLQLKIDQWKREAERLREEAFSLGSPGFDADPVQVSKTSSALERNVIKYLDMIAKIEKLITRYSQKRNRIVKQIHDLGNVQYMQVLYLRYVECKRLKAVAAEMSLSEDWTRHLLKQAEKAFGNRHKRKSKNDTKKPVE